MSKKSVSPSSWGAGFKSTVVSRKDSAIRVTRIEIPKSLREAISHSLETSGQKKVKTG